VSGEDRIETGVVDGHEVAEVEDDLSGVTLAGFLEHISEGIARSQIQLSRQLDDTLIAGTAAADVQRAGHPRYKGTGRAVGGQRIDTVELAVGSVGIDRGEMTPQGPPSKHAGPEVGEYRSDIPLPRPRRKVNHARHTSSIASTMVVVRAAPNLS